jgi:GNAT superfamily N-acetyltransferase
LSQITDRQWIQSRLEQNRPWTAYALADLEPGYFEHTSWFCDAAGLGLTLLYQGFSVPLILLIEHSGNFESVLNEIDGILDRSDRYMVSMPGNMPLLRNRYRVQDERKMIRMTLDARQFRPALDEHVVRLSPEHIQAVKSLYAEGPPEFFLDRMLQDGIYFGIFEGQALVAVAGTHIVSCNYGVGGLGNIYTRADRRSRGYATFVTSAVSSHLLRAGIKTILLNVREENAPAIRVYDRLGYQPHCRYFEIVARR